MRNNNILYWMAANGLLMMSCVESLQMVSRPGMMRYSHGINDYKIASSCGSGFTSHSCKYMSTKRVTRNNCNANRLVMYEPNNPKDEEDVSSVWSALATTENWISQTLSNPKLGSSNPYSRKEVSYVCETSKDTASIVAGVFRHVKEARETGEQHAQENCQLEKDRSTTLRQTQVVVIPWCAELDEYHTFQGTLEAINSARRNARDLYTLTDQDKADSPTSNWSVSINAAGLHPNFGAKTAEEMLRDLQEEEETGEVDLNLKEYKERRNKARQSPFPSIVIEVRATPPIDFGPGSPPQSQQPKKAQPPVPAPSKDDLERLEALFGMSAAKKTSVTYNEDEEVDFYDSIGKAFGIQEISMESPDDLARHWIQENDPLFHADTSNFYSCDTKHVDAAYEFVFSSIAMMMENDDAHTRSYLILPNFVPTSATSFEKFATEVENILKTIPSSLSSMTMTTFHPEHISTKDRCDVPVFVLQKKE